MYKIFEETATVQMIMGIKHHPLLLSAAQLMTPVIQYKQETFGNGCCHYVYCIYMYVMITANNEWCLPITAKMKAMNMPSAHGGT